MIVCYIYVSKFTILKFLLKKKFQMMTEKKQVLVLNDKQRSD